MQSVPPELWVSVFPMLSCLPLPVAFLRGTTADPNRNVTAEREALDLDNLAMAMAVKNSGGERLRYPDWSRSKGGTSEASEAAPVT